MFTTKRADFKALELISDLQLNFQEMLQKQNKHYCLVSFLTKINLHGHLKTLWCLSLGRTPLLRKHSTMVQ